MQMEDNTNVLEKFGRNITEDAKNGKIDPVQGAMKKFVESQEYYPEKQKTIPF